MEKADLSVLTDLERRVLERVVAGDSQKHIAHALGISIGSTKAAQRRAKWRMGARNIAHLSAIGARAGL